jgi:curli biogenesis system outer membrane secretion channel CsgG
MAGMKKNLCFIVLGLMVLSLNGCVSLRKNHKIYAPKIPQGAQAEPVPFYSGPKVYVAVADFEIKTAKANNEMGSGLRQMLITALNKSSYFFILGRQNLLQPAQLPEDSVSSEDTTRKADFIVTATVIDFESQASGGNDGVGGGGGLNNGRFGGLLGETLNKAHLSMNISIINATTSAVLSTILVHGQAAADVGKSGTSELPDNSELDSRLSGYINTPMGKAIRECINEAAQYIAQTAKLK